MTYTEDEFLFQDSNEQVQFWYNDKGVQSSDTRVFLGSSSQILAKLWTMKSFSQKLYLFVVDEYSGDFVDHQTLNFEVNLNSDSLFAHIPVEEIMIDADQLL
jgi:hypothetical protein